MDIEIRAHGLKLSAAQRLHVERRVGSALDRFEHKLRGVTVVIEDLNGPKGGADIKAVTLDCVGGAAKTWEPAKTWGPAKTW